MHPPAEQGAMQEATLVQAHQGLTVMISSNSSSFELPKLGKLRHKDTAGEMRRLFTLSGRVGFSGSPAARSPALHRRLDGGLLATGPLRARKAQ